jgi:PAS domain S-box-containing protein
MTPANLEQMSKEELIAELRKLQTTEARSSSTASEPPTSRLIHDLQVHQVELEMQNRQLRESQELLEESRSRYSDLYDFAPVGYLTLDAGGRIREINLTGAAMLGAPRETLIDRPFAAVVSVKEKQAFRDHLRDCAAKKALVVTTELTLSTERHGAVVVQLVTFATGDEGRPGGGFRTALVDISRLKEMETRLRFLAEAGETLASSLDYQTTLATVVRLAVPLFADICFIDVLDEEGRVQRLDVVFSDGGNQSEMSGRIARIEPRPGWRTPQDDVIESGQSMLLEDVPRSVLEKIAQDGQHPAVTRANGIKSMLIVPLRARERVLGALTLVAAHSGRRYTAADRLFAEDIGRRAAMAIDNARLHAQAQRATRARDAVLALVSHDLRNPLGVILLQTLNLLSVPAAEDRRSKGRRAIEAIQRASTRMNRLIGDLLDVTSIEAGHLSLLKQGERSGTLIAAALEASQELAAKKSQTLRRDLGDLDGGDVLCDAGRILQVFTNLIGNAIKFSPEGATITVCARRLGDEVEYSVTDTGPGIPPEQLPHIFDRFWQATETAELGTGLGLSIAKGIVEAHGGRIWAESRGTGSTFCFTLPRVPAVVSHPAAAEPASSNGLEPATPLQPARTDRTAGSSSRGRIVLVVDDDADFRMAMGMTLEREGYQVVPAANGAEALAYLGSAAKPTFMILLDLNMPVMDGWKFLAERDRAPALGAVPVIIISGAETLGTQSAEGKIEYFQKPVRPEKLLEAMHSFAQRRGAGAPRESEPSAVR